MFPLDDLPRPLRPRIRRRSPRPNPNLNPRQRQDNSITSSVDGSFGATSFEPSSSAFDSPSGFSSNSGAASSQGGTSTNGGATSLTTTSVVSTTGFTSAASTPPSSSIVSTTTPPSHSTTTPPSSSSSPSLTTPPVPSSLSSGFVFSTFTSSFLSDINGSPTTIVTPIVTSLRTSPPSTSTSSRAAIITGSAIAGLALLLIALTALFVVRRRRRRQRYWALSRKRLPSRATFLASEDMDLPFPSPPFATAEHDDPFASHSTHRVSSSAGSLHGGGTGPGPGPYAQSIYSRSQSSQTQVLPPRPSTSSPPRLLRVRASESGSIFRESVWPPPSAASQLIDPLTSPSQSVDLARIVTDVMGPHGSTPEMGPLLPFAALASREHEHEHDHGQEVQEGGGERGSMISPPLSLSYVLSPPNMTSMDDWPRRSSPDLQSHPQSQSHLHQQQQPSITPSPPETPPSRTRWLSRSPNPSPRTSHFPL